jgi:hypothetical protein
MSFLAAVKTFFYFLFKAACLRDPRSFFLILLISFSNGPRYLVYFVGISLFGFTLRGSISLALIFRVSASEIVVQPECQIDKSFPRTGELLDRYRILNARFKLFV